MKRTLIQLWNDSAPLRFLIVVGWNFVFGYGAFAGLYWLLNVAAILGITMSHLTHRFNGR